MATRKESSRVGSRMERLSLKLSDCWPFSPSGAKTSHASEGLQCGLLVLLNVEQFVEMRDFENFIDLRIDGTKNQRAAGCFDFFVQCDELPEGGARKVLDIAEVEDYFTPAQLIHQAKELLADDLDILFIQDFFVGEIHHGHFANIFHFQPSPLWLRGHENSSYDRHPHVSKN